MATLRALRESDYDTIIRRLNEWWGGRSMADMLPRLFFQHFNDTSFVVESDGEIAAFLVGFVSQARPGAAYIHFVGVAPGQRGGGLGRRLYEAFFEAAQARGCTVVSCVTSPLNQGSIAFHTRMGFAAQPGDDVGDGVPFKRDYDGPGQDRVVFVRRLDAG